MNDFKYFLSHRLPIARALLESGNEVVVGYGYSEPDDMPNIAGINYQTLPLPLSRRGKNVFRELWSCFQILKLFKQVRPDLIHCISVKPYLYGGIAAKFSGVPGVVSAVAGLGTLFIRTDFWGKFLLSLLYPLYRFSFSHPNQIVIFQNEDDFKVLENWIGLDREKAFFIRGSGINLDDFCDFDEPNHIITVCLAARLLRDKGILDFVSAATILNKRGVRARFWLAGDLDTGNPTSLSARELTEISDRGIVEVLGFKESISTLYALSHIICLPSYREGFPKSLMEAAAAGRPVVTTDVPGCRDAIIPGRTGLLVPPGSPTKLADALQTLIENPDMRVAMGKAGRKLAESEFSVSHVVERHLEAYERLLLRNAETTRRN